MGAILVGSRLDSEPVMEVPFDYDRVPLGHSLVSHNADDFSPIDDLNLHDHGRKNVRRASGHVRREGDRARVG